MALQDGGWPLGLQPVNVRAGFIRNLDLSGSLSLSTLITGSPSSSSFTSSDLDTESTGSFFHERSITLGSLIGINSILELSNRSFRSSRTQDTVKNKKSHKNRAWFSLCPRSQLSGDSTTAGNAPSLGHFLEAERRASNAYRRNHAAIGYELDGFPPESRPGTEHNSLFSDGFVVPPRTDADGSTAKVVSNDAREAGRGLNHANGYGFTLLFSCMNGQCNQ